MFKKAIKILVSVVIVVAIAGGAYYYYQYQKQFPSTTDAYVQAHTIYIAPRVSGQIKQVYVEDHQYVKKGQLLFEIDPKPYQIALAKAQAVLANTSQQVRAEEDAVVAAKALVTQRQAQLTNTRKTFKRVMSLVKQHLYSIARGDTVISELQVAEATLNAAISQLNEAKAKRGQHGDANAAIREAIASVAETKLNLDYTKVYAPGDGYIAKFSLRKGVEVSAFQELFALVESHVWWVTANFKETDLENIKPNQKATIKVDMYPGVVFHGKVQSLGAGSGASFALLPPENATGNWVKVTQRFPVRVIITNPNPKYPLRLGSSCTVTIDAG